MKYQGYSCNQSGQEMMIVARRVSDMSGTQDRHATGNTVAMGVGLVIFWPALFSLASKDQRDKLGRLKGEYEALEEAAGRKNCSVAKEIHAAKKMEEERKAKQSQESAPSSVYKSHD